MKKLLKDLFLGPFRSIIVLKKELDRLGAPFITNEGHAALNDPEKMKQVNKAVKEYNASGNTSAYIIVEFD